MTLCVALLAFVLIEQGSPAHAIEPQERGAITHFADQASDGQSGDEIPGAPLGSQPDHCCCAHVSGTLAAAHATLAMQVSLRRAPLLNSGNAPQTAPLGLDRPPKASAIV